ncbi:MAG: metallophosphoesterase [Puia sp.]|nr:metallophosphoesterase [Puia sp.]
MKPPFPHRIKKQQLWLSPGRCVFWEEEKALIVSDLHFGKTGHFRKSGIAVPATVYRDDLQRLVAQIQYFQPRQLLIVGDLFHSRENRELELFQKWRADLPDLAFRLIKGNHDILHDDWYAAAGIELSEKKLRIGEFLFMHDIGDLTHPDLDTAVCDTGLSDTPLSDSPGATPNPTPVDPSPADLSPTDGYVFSGHIHPGIRINGVAKQALQFPCFYFGGAHAILPAFSRFTGMVSIYPKPDENVFAIIQYDSILQIQ